ncbi:MAG TPA: hypothetical protein VLG47_04965 [Candidatus Saccharimonadales bacterium]|nr:hypothetical protein [Candidatus Saccharimonadales bacterium]
MNSSLCTTTLRQASAWRVIIQSKPQAARAASANMIPAELFDNTAILDTLC